MNKKQNKKKFMFYLDLDVNEMLEQLAEENYLTKSGFITMLILKEYKKYQKENGEK